MDQTFDLRMKRVSESMLIESAGTSSEPSKRLASWRRKAGGWKSDSPNSNLP